MFLRLLFAVAILVCSAPLSADSTIANQLSHSYLIGRGGMHPMEKTFSQAGWQVSPRLIERFTQNDDAVRSPSDFALAYFLVSKVSWRAKVTELYSLLENLSPNRERNQFLLRLIVLWRHSSADFKALGYIHTPKSEETFRDLLVDTWMDESLPGTYWMTTIRVFVRNDGVTMLRHYQGSGYDTKNAQNFETTPDHKWIRSRHVSTHFWQRFSLSPFAFFGGNSKPITIVKNAF